MNFINFIIETTQEDAGWLIIVIIMIIFYIIDKFRLKF